MYRGFESHFFQFVNMKLLKNGTLHKNEQHPFHLVDSSPWPFLVSQLVTTFVISILWKFSKIRYSQCWGFVVFFMLCWSIFFWFAAIVREATFQGHHTFQVQQGLRMGMVLFIVSEIMFFFSFFWGFFHAALAPAVSISSVWPPINIEVLDPWAIPLLNTVILLSSGVSVTWAHRAIIVGDRSGSLIGLLITVAFGFIFTWVQLVEYIEIGYFICSSSYGSLFFLCTGFHGFHVILGTIFLFTCFWRLKNYHFTKEHHFGFEAAAWYWHFVDVVWLFLFVTIYWWGGEFSY
jgi:heme/copper-type cytochrome/quinol oxidase subunit 3